MLSASFVFSAVAIVVSVAAYLGYRLSWDKRDMDRFTNTLTRLESVIDRMEMATFVVAADLSVAQTAVDKVATNLASAKTAVETVASELASSQERADRILGGAPGEAADAGAQSGTATK